MRHRVLAQFTFARPSELRRSLPAAVRPSRATIRLAILPAGRDPADRAQVVEDRRRGRARARERRMFASCTSAKASCRAAGPPSPVRPPSAASTASCSTATSCTILARPRVGTIIVALVPDDGQACRLAAAPARSPASRRRSSNQWNACARRRRRPTPSPSGIALGRSRRALSTPRHHLLEHRPHVVERLDCDHAAVALGEHARQLPRAGTEVEHGGVRVERQQLEQLGRIGRSRPLVLGGDAVEARAFDAPVSQRRQAETFGSP